MELPFIPHPQHWSPVDRASGHSTLARDLNRSIGSARRGQHAGRPRPPRPALTTHLSPHPKIIHQMAAGDALPSASAYVLTPILSDADFSQICLLEAASYPADEAASPPALAYRRAHANPLFRVLRQATPTTTPSPPLGFACATAAPAGTRALTHASMSAHAAGGGVACVHSVVVAPAARRRGAGAALVALYVAQLRAAGYERTLLLCKAHLRGFYAAAGFVCDGESRVQHGADMWYDMRAELATGEPAAAPPSNTIAPTQQ